MSGSGSEDLEERLAQAVERAVDRLAPREAAPAAKPRRNWNAYSAVIASLVGLLALVVSAYTAYVQGEQLRLQDEQLRVQRSAETEQQRVQDEQLRAQRSAQTEQLSEQRQQLRAQVWPYLQIWTSDVNMGTAKVGMYVTNHGTGPARVRAVRVTVGGVPVKTWADVEQAAGFTGKVTLGHASINGVVLPPGKDYVIMIPSDDEPSRVKLKELILREKHGVAMTICYCSILDECWVAPRASGAQGDKPGPPDSCPIPPGERFED